MTYRVQIDDEVREATREEAAAIDSAHAAAIAQAQQEISKAAAVASAKTKLAALGLTEAEIIALIGA